jgi:glycine dehydrogenase subunit 1
VNHPYIPRGTDEEREMLRVIGVESFEDLLEPVPEHLRLKELLPLPRPWSEIGITRRLSRLAARNAVAPEYRVFLGAGAYDHAVPAAVDHLSFRSEYYTAYTPYQPEVAQGTLTAIFEFQTMMAELTGMDLANASLYDGASALAEAVLLSVNRTRRDRVVLAGTLHPHYRQVLATYLEGQGITLVDDPAPAGTVDRTWLRDALAEPAACVVASSPNFLGQVEDHTDVFAAARENGALGIAVFDPHALALYRTPGEMGADLAVGEGRSLGSPPSYGGPALGLFAASEKFARFVPGRLIGETVDQEGRRAFVMTLQTREQHIRREKATSNICTNQGLYAVRATIYLSLMGPTGLRGVAEQCLERAHYAAEALDALDGFSVDRNAPFFQEFAVTCPVAAAKVVEAGLARKVVPGLDLGRFRKDWADRLLVCVNEQHTREDLDDLVATVAAAAGEAAHV